MSAFVRLFTIVNVTIIERGPTIILIIPWVAVSHMKTHVTFHKSNMIHEYNFLAELGWVSILAMESTLHSKLAMEQLDKEG